MSKQAAGKNSPRCAIKCVVLDFDGVFTDLTREWTLYRDRYARALLREPRLDGIRSNLIENWGRVAQQVDIEPLQSGWTHMGKMIAPAHADPYIWCTSVLQRILKEHGFFADLNEQQELVYSLYAASYRADVIYRPDAARFISELAQLGLHVYIVSNAGAEKVAAQISNLNPAILDKIILRGDALKFVVGPGKHSHKRFLALPDEAHVEELVRPLFPKRGFYKDVLFEIWNETGVEPEDTLVCGDIYELDLLLPAAMGAPVHLVTSPHTPMHELHMTARLHGREALGPNLMSILERIKN